MTPALSAVVLPDRHPVSAFLDDVRAAEAAGVGTVWTYDHLRWPLLADSAWYGAVPLLAAAAAVTTDRVRLGTLIASPNFRHPVPFAKELMTLDQLTGGRLEVGVGVGTEGPDARVLGESLTRAERTDRFAEWLVLLDTLLRQPVTTVHGRRYTAVEAAQIPGCVQQPRLPFTVAAAGPRALRLAARYGSGWATYGPFGADVPAQEWLAAVASQSRGLTEALAEEGRPASALRRVVLVGLEVIWPFESSERYLDTLGRLADAGIDEVAVHWPRPDDGRGVPAAALPMVLAAHGS